MRNVAIIGASAIPVAKIQQRADADVQVLEHEVLGLVVRDAIRDAEVEKRDIQSAVFTVPRPYTRQSYFHTFLTSHLRLNYTGVVMEVMGNGMTGALAFRSEEHTSELQSH